MSEESEADRYVTGYVYNAESQGNWDTLVHTSNP